MNALRVANAGRVLCVAGAALGALGLLGWIIDAPLLITVVPGQPPMMPNTAVALCFVGVAGAVRRSQNARRGLRWFSGVLAAVALVVGVGTLAEYALSIDLHIDQALLASSAGPHPGRPSPPTALAVALLAGAILLFDSRPTARGRPSEWLIFAAGLTAYTALMGHLLGAGLLYRMPGAPVIGVALPSAMSLLLISTGLLLERPSAGFMRLATSSGPGGELIRSLTFPAVIVPAVLGIVVARSFRALGIEDFPVVIATMDTALAAIGLLVLIIAAAPLDRSHAALEASRLWTRNLLEQASDGVFVADLTGRYTEVNTAACSMLGYSRDEIVGKTIVDLIPPEDVERLSRSKQLLLGGDVAIDEWTLRRKDGTYLPVEVSAKILPDGRWQAFVRDITERQRLSEELRRSEARASGIVSVSADAIISIDQAQRIAQFNGAAEKIFGYSQAEALGAPLDLLIPERFRGAHRRHIEGFVGGHSVARRMGERGTPILGLRKNGEEFPADAAISKLTVDGETILTVALRDASEQQRVENEIRLGRERFDLALQGADLAAWDWNVVTGEVIFNPRWAEMRGFRPDEVAPRVDSWISGVHPDDLGRVQEAVQRHFDGLTREYVNEHRCRTKSGQWIWILDRGRVFARDVEGRPIRMVGTELDITERKRLEEERQRAIRARDDVLGIVAHDLRNPLGSIMIQAALLRRRADAASQKPAQLIERAAHRMNRLIQDLLDVTRIEAGMLSLDRAWVSARSVVDDSAEALQSLASSASLELRLDVAEDLPDVFADRDELSRVFENLVGNAVKFTEHGGRVTIGAAPRGGELLFWVADTGIGIAAENLPHVFDRFWQAKKAERRGAGLGLPIVKGIVEAHGGRVWVESWPGRGSTFYFTIPAAPLVEAWRAEPAPQRH